jgi:diguanylate cyclase (GGDEF)-like protein
MNQEQWTLLEERYRLRFLDDVAFRDNHHLTFWFDWQESPRTLHIVSGSLASLGFGEDHTVPLANLAQHIEIHNELAEVEGRETFLASLIRRIDRLQTDLVLYIPFKHPNGRLWTTVALEAITHLDNKPQLIYGRVVNQTFHIPHEIVHYQRTYQDALTRLFTRETLRNHLNSLVIRPGTYAMYMDLDGFKQINDVFGHKSGDAFLKAIADAFIALWEQDVIYYRLGGDEFFVLVYHHDETMVKVRAQRMIKAIEAMEVQGQKAGVSASIGIVPVMEEYKNYDKLLDLADKAMYEAKREGKGRCKLIVPIL